jgi:hypothetical protein
MGPCVRRDDKVNDKSHEVESAHLPGAGTPAQSAPQSATIVLQLNFERASFTCS